MYLQHILAPILRTLTHVMQNLFCDQRALRRKREKGFIQGFYMSNVK